MMRFRLLMEIVKGTSLEGLSCLFQSAGVVVPG